MYVFAVLKQTVFKPEIIPVPDTSSINSNIKESVVILQAAAVLTSSVRTTKPELTSKGLGL